MDDPVAQNVKVAVRNVQVRHVPPHRHDKVKEAAQAREDRRKDEDGAVAPLVKEQLINKDCGKGNSGSQQAGISYLRAEVRSVKRGEKKARVT